MRRSIDDALDDHPAGDDERPPVVVGGGAERRLRRVRRRASRVVLTVEEAGQSRVGPVAHLSPDTARRMRAAIAAALREIGEPPGP